MNDSQLVSCSGGSLPVTRFVPPQQKVEFEIVYEGKLPSGSERDIIAKADFTERGTGTRQQTGEDELTAVRVEVVTTHVAIENPNMNRHVYGVGEQTNFKFLPASSVNEVSSSLGLIEDPMGGMSRFTAPPESDPIVVTVKCGSVEKEIDLYVIEPVGYVVHSIDCTFGNMPNEAGMINLNFTNRVYPLFVSFYAVEISEIPMVSTNAIGYFAQPDHVDDLDHGKRGAYGQWSRINEDNSTTDEVNMSHCLKPWNGGGSYTWPIPNAWRVVGDGFSTNVFTHTDQRFELDADGTARVSKFGWTGERGTNDTHRVYEGASR